MKNTAYALAGEHLTGVDRGVRLRRSAATSCAEPQVERGRGLDRPASPGSRSATRPTRSRRDGSVDADRPGDGPSRRRRRPGRARRPDRDEDDPLGVLGLPARPSHDAARRPRTGSWRRRSRRRGRTRRTGPPTIRRGLGGLRSTLLEAFADHDSASVQASIWIVGKAILERHPELDEVSMSLPNLHHWTVDLSPFGIENDRQVYVATTEPYGLIEATIRTGLRRDQRNFHMAPDHRADLSDRARRPGVPAPTGERRLDDPTRDPRRPAASRRDRFDCPRDRAHPPRTAADGPCDSLGVTRAGEDPGHGSPHRPAPDQRDPRRRRPDRHRAVRRPRPDARRRPGPARPGGPAGGRRTGAEGRSPRDPGRRRDDGRGRRPRRVRQAPPLDGAGEPAGGGRPGPDAPGELRRRRRPAAADARAVPRRSRPAPGVRQRAVRRDEAGQRDRPDEVAFSGRTSTETRRGWPSSWTRPASTPRCTSSGTRWRPASRSSRSG